MYEHTHYKNLQHHVHSMKSSRFLINFLLEIEVFLQRKRKYTTKKALINLTPV